MNINMKDMIDGELDRMILSGEVKNRIREKAAQGRLHQGWDWEYLGMYRFAESYTSAQGYKVNLVERTMENGDTGDAVLEKNAVFAADGIKYSLRGRVSMETMKLIVDMMK